MKIEIVHRHEIPALTVLADAIRYAADQDRSAREFAARQHREATEYAARAAAGLVHAKFKADAPEDPEWAAWLVSGGADGVDELEVQDLLHARRVLQGVEKVDEEARRRAITHYAAAEAAYGVPHVEARGA